MGGTALPHSWRHGLLFMSGVFAALVVANVVDSAPVVIGGRTWVPFVLFLLLVLLVPFAALANSGRKRLAGRLLAIFFSLPFWIVAGGGVLDWWNRKHDTSAGEWMKASIASKSLTRRGTYFRGRLEQALDGERLDISLRTLEDWNPGAKIWVKVHRGALGWPWGSDWRVTPSN